MESMYSVPLSELIEKMGLENLTPEIDTENILIKHIDVNRPALQLAGFFDYFDSGKRNSCFENLCPIEKHQILTI